MAGHHASEQLYDLSLKHLDWRARRALSTELEQVAQMMEHTERPMKLTDGVLNGRFGVLVLSDERLIFVAEGGETLLSKDVDAVEGATVVVDGECAALHITVEAELVRIRDVGDAAWAEELRAALVGSTVERNLDPVPADQLGKRDAGVWQSEVAWACTSCDATYSVGYERARCQECEAPLLGQDGALRPDLDLDPDASWPADELIGLEGDDEGVLQPFATDNPFFTKIFSDPDFGMVPRRAIGLLREVSPDPDEKLLGAIRTRHGGHFGYLLATTSQLRWVQTVPFRTDDYWSYAYPLEVQGGPLQQSLLRTIDGLQFQMRWGRAKAFAHMYRLCQQGLAWQEPQSEQEVVGHEPTHEPLPQGPSLAGELRELAELHRDGILTDEEFTEAKVRLLRP